MNQVKRNIIIYVTIVIITFCFFVVHLILNHENKSDVSLTLKVNKKSFLMSTKNSDVMLAPKKDEKIKIKKEANKKEKNIHQIKIVKENETKKKFFKSRKVNKIFFRKRKPKEVSYKKFLSKLNYAKKLTKDYFQTARKLIKHDSSIWNNQQRLKELEKELKSSDTKVKTNTTKLSIVAALNAKYQSMLFKRDILYELLIILEKKKKVNDFIKEGMVKDISEIDNKMITFKTLINMGEKVDPNEFNRLVFLYNDAQKKYLVLLQDIAKDIEIEDTIKKRHEEINQELPIIKKETVKLKNEVLIVYNKDKKTKEGKAKKIKERKINEKTKFDKVYFKKLCRLMDANMVKVVQIDIKLNKGLSLARASAGYIYLRKVALNSKKTLDKYFTDINKEAKVYRDTPEVTEYIKKLKENKEKLDGFFESVDILIRDSKEREQAKGKKVITQAEINFKIVARLQKNFLKHIKFLEKIGEHSPDEVEKKLKEITKFIKNSLATLNGMYKSPKLRKRYIRFEEMLKRYFKIVTDARKKNKEDKVKKFFKKKQKQHSSFIKITERHLLGLKNLNKKIGKKLLSKNAKVEDYLKIIKKQEEVLKDNYKRLKAIEVDEGNKVILENLSKRLKIFTNILSRLKKRAIKISKERKKREKLAKIRKAKEAKAKKEREARKAKEEKTKKEKLDKEEEAFDKEIDSGIDDEEETKAKKDDKKIKNKVKGNSPEIWNNDDENMDEWPDAVEDSKKLNDEKDKAEQLKKSKENSEFSCNSQDKKNVKVAKLKKNLKRKEELKKIAKESILPKRLRKIKYKTSDDYFNESVRQFWEFNDYDSSILLVNMALKSYNKKSIISKSLDTVDVEKIKVPQKIIDKIISTSYSKIYLDNRPENINPGIYSLSNKKLIRYLMHKYIIIYITKRNIIAKANAYTFYKKYFDILDDLSDNYSKIMIAWCQLYFGEPYRGASTLRSLEQDSVIASLCLIEHYVVKRQKEIALSHLKKIKFSEKDKTINKKEDKEKKAIVKNKIATLKPKKAKNEEKNKLILDMINSLINKNCAAAFFMKGFWFKYGFLVNKNHIQAKACFKKAAKLGHTNAMYQIALLNFEKVGIAPFLRSLLQYESLDEIKNIHNVHGYYLAEKLILKKKNAKENIKRINQALKYLVVAAHNNHITSNMILAVLHYTKFLVKTPVDNRAIFYFLQAARLNHSRAYVYLADFLLNGYGALKQDRRKAVAFIKKAADTKDVIGIFRLGKLYAEGIVVKKDYDKAFNYIKYAHARNYPPASLYTAKSLIEGKFTVKSIKSGMMLLKLLIKAKNVKAMLYLAHISRFGKFEVDKDVSKAIDNYTEAAKLQHPEAHFALGEIFYKGYKGKKSNYKFAYDAYMQATKFKNHKAMLRIGQMYLLGQYKKKDEKKAKEWFEKAISYGNNEAKTLLATIK